MDGTELAELEIEELHVGHRTVIAASGDLDLATADVLTEAVERAVHSGAAEVWLDLNGVTFIDSTGLRVVLAARAALHARSKRMAIICATGPVRRVLRITGLDQTLAVHPDRATAHAAS